MKAVLKWALRIVLALALIAVVLGIWKRDEIQRVMAVNSLFAADKIVRNFSNMKEAFLWAEMSRGGGPVTELPEGETATLPQDVADWIERRDVTALVILKDGKIVTEDYYLGTHSADLRIGWSISKSFLSASFGIARAEGMVPDLNALVTDYVPRLKGTAYNGATILNVLQMSSGVTFDEEYLDYYSDINRMGRTIALGGTMDGFAASLKEIDRPAGEEWEYTSIDTHVLGMVLRAATGRSLIDYMEEKLIRPMGLEADPYYITDGVGVAFALGGINMTTRDYARMGLMYLQDGVLGGTQIVPRDWVYESTMASAKTEPGKLGYGYLWWIPVGAEDGQFMARGIYGQYVYVDRPAGVVIVVNAADRSFRDEGIAEQNVAIFREITRSLTPMNMDPSLNVLGEPLASCSSDPVTGFFRNGCCDTGPMDQGSHTVCAVMTAEFLALSKYLGNDLSTPRPEFGFAGLNPGDRWCLCAARFLQAHDEGAAPRVHLRATHQNALDIVPLDVLTLYAVHDA